MQKEVDIVLQPYGKDDLYFNLIATSHEEWFFGPSDIDSFDSIHKQSLMHCYIKIKGKNPEYYKFKVGEDFKLKKETKALVSSENSKPKGVNEIYVFLIYDMEKETVSMNYTPDYEEFEEIEKVFNMIGAFLITGDSLTVEEEALNFSVYVPLEVLEESIQEIIEEEKNEDE